jgi:hypothetical protein
MRGSLIKGEGVIHKRRGGTFKLHGTQNGIDNFVLF